VVKYTTDPKFANLTYHNDHAAFGGTNAARESAQGSNKSTRRFCTTAQLAQTPAATAALGSFRQTGGLPHAMTRATAMGRTMGRMGRLLKK
jgi:hypothetical protein